MFSISYGLAPPAAVGVTSGVYKRKPPTLQSWKQVFSSQRKQGGMNRGQLHMKYHIPTQVQKIPSELCIQHVALMAVSLWHKEHSPVVNVASEVNSNEIVSSCF